MPRSVNDAYLDRLKKIKLCTQETKHKVAEIALCRDSVEHFVNTWCLTFDPRREPKHFPFDTYDFQNEALKWINERFENKEVGVIEKTRDMGASWLCCAWALHGWLFRSGFSVMFGSIKEAKVDDQTLDSIFGKLRYLLARIPRFLGPYPPDRSHLNRHMMLIHPINKNEIVGDAMSIGFGRGGRKSIVFLDEFAHVQHSEAVWSSVSDNSNCIVAVSTPFGKGNQFAWLRHEAKAPLLTLHWTRHPEKSREWYEKKKETMHPWQVAQELDLSYDRSATGRIYQRFDREYHVAKEVIACNPDCEQWVSWDFGIADPTAIIFGQVAPPGIVQVWGYFELTGQDTEFFVPFVKGFAPQGIRFIDSKDAKELYRWLKKIPQGHKASHYGDNAGVARTANSKRSCRDILREHGIVLQTSGKQTFDWREACLDNLLKLRHNRATDSFYSVFEISPDCERLIDCMFNYRWEAEDKVNDEKLKPKHDWASHGVTALEFFAINRFPLKTKAQVNKSTRVR